MATRALIKVYDGNDEICTIYKHWNGAALKDVLEKFISWRKVVNGIPHRYLTEKVSVENAPVANGMDDFAAQLICYLKSKSPIGDVYLCKPGTKNVGEEYVYKITNVGKKLILTVEKKGSQNGAFEPLSGLDEAG